MSVISILVVTNIAPRRNVLFSNVNSHSGNAVCGAENNFCKEALFLSYGSAEFSFICHGYLMRTPCPAHTAVSMLLLPPLQSINQSSYSISIDKVAVVEKRKMICTEASRDAVPSIQPVFQKHRPCSSWDILYTSLLLSSLYVPVDSISKTVELPSIEVLGSTSFVSIDDVLDG